MAFEVAFYAPHLSRLGPAILSPGAPVGLWKLRCGYASINGSGTFRGDPHVWNGHFRKTSVPHVWNGVNWIMIISVYATSKAPNDFALATKLFLHQVRFHGTVWKRSGTVWNRTGTVWNEVWNGIGRFAPNLGNGGSKMFQLSCC